MGQNVLESISFIFAIASLVQGIVWFVIPLLAILAYNCKIPIDAVIPYTFRDYSVSYFQARDCQYQQAYIRHDIEKCVDNLTDANNLVALASVIFTVNVLLTISSICLISAMAVAKKKLFIFFLYIFLFLNIFVVILDFAATTVIATDYAAFSTASCGKNIDINSGSSVLLALDIISSKGVILWLMNICLTLFLFVEASRTAGCSCEWDIDYNEGTEAKNLKYYSSSKIQNVADKEELNKPIEIVYRNGSPEHSALARWPALAINSPSVVREPRPNEVPRRNSSPTNKQIPLQQQRASAPVTRNASQSTADLAEPIVVPRPVVPHPVAPHPVALPPNDPNRPMSLEEAIKTMKPLRHVKNSPYRY